MDLQWLQSDEAKKISENAKAKAWKDFEREYPFADLSKFEAKNIFKSGSWFLAKRFRIRQKVFVR